MPTARELLEQADALMRRDRDALATGERARPSSTPITLAARPLAGGAMSPRTIQREPIAPSVARTSLPVHPTDSPAFAAPEAASFVPASLLRQTHDDEAMRGEPTFAPAGPRDEAAVAPTPEGDFPTLTEAVVDIVEPHAGDVVAADAEAEDVPVLTDAVEDIDIVETDELARGEPSIWDAAARGDVSLLGAAPDSIVVVPPLDRPPAGPPAERDPLGLDQPAMGFVPPPSALAPAVPADAPDAGLVDANAVETAPAAQAVPEATAPQMPESEPAPATSSWAQFPAGTQSPSDTSSQPDDAAAPGAQGERPAAVTAPSHADEAARPVADQGMLAGFAPLRPQPGYDARAALDWSDTGASETGEAITEARVSLPEPEPPPEVAVAAWAPTPTSASTAVSAAWLETPSPSVASGAAPVLDDARIAEAVDEIRMQVLQRIDIFTDTTLRAKLGEQLQPLVERASAELVAAINQHVGDLLRTYVAEALEQEIERWRNGQR